MYFRLVHYALMMYLFYLLTKIYKYLKMSRALSYILLHKTIHELTWIHGYLYWLGLHGGPYYRIESNTCIRLDSAASHVQDVKVTCKKGYHNDYYTCYIMCELTCLVFYV